MSTYIFRMKKVMKITTNPIRKMKRQFFTILKIYLWAGMERWVFRGSICIFFISRLGRTDINCMLVSSQHYLFSWVLLAHFKIFYEA